MKKTILLSALLLMAAVCAARPAVKKKAVKLEVPVERAYDEVRVSSFVSVVLDDRDPASVEVTTDERLAKYVVVEADNGKLNIRIKNFGKQDRKRKRKDEDFAATVVRVGREPVRSVVADGMSKVVSEKGIAGDRIALSVSGMSKVEVPVTCGDARISVGGMSKLESEVNCSGLLEIETVGMSKTKLTGQSARLKAEVSGMSKLAAGALTVTEYADCSVGGMSKADVTCEGELKASTEGMSKLVYGGNCTLAEGSSVNNSSLKKR